MKNYNEVTEIAEVISRNIPGISPEQVFRTAVEIVFPAKNVRVKSVQTSALPTSFKKNNGGYSAEDLIQLVTDVVNTGGILTSSDLKSLSKNMGVTPTTARYILTDVANDLEIEIAFEEPATKFSGSHIQTIKKWFKIGRGNGWSTQEIAIQAATELRGFFPKDIELQIRKLEGSNVSKPGRCAVL